MNLGAVLVLCLPLHCPHPKKIFEPQERRECFDSCRFCVSEENCFSRFCSQQIEQPQKRIKTRISWKLCQTIVNSFLLRSYNSSSSAKFTTTWNYSFRSCSVARAICEPKSNSGHESITSQAIFFLTLFPGSSRSELAPLSGLTRRTLESGCHENSALRPKSPKTQPPWYIKRKKDLNSSQFL